MLTARIWVTWYSWQAPSESPKTRKILILTTLRRLTTTLRRYLLIEERTDSWLIQRTRVLACWTTKLTQSDASESALTVITSPAVMKSETLGFTISTRMNYPRSSFLNLTTVKWSAWLIRQLFQQAGSVSLKLTGKRTLCRLLRKDISWRVVVVTNKC